MAETITVVASIAKVQTLADNGLRVSIDLPETAIYAAAWLMTCKAAGVAIDLTLAQHERKGKTETEMQANAEYRNGDG